MKNILFMIPTLDGGGAEKVLVNLVNHINKEKYNVTVYSIFDVGSNRKFLSREINYQYFSKMLYRGNIHLMKLFSPKFLFKIMIKNDYDIIISYLEGPSTRIVSGCNHSKTRLLNWIHTSIDNKGIILNSYRNESEYLNSQIKFNETIFVSKDAMDNFNLFFNKLKISQRVIYNSINKVEIQRKSREKIDDVNFEGNFVKLVSIGRFVREKGYDRLLRIVRRLIDDGFNIHFYLLGKGNQEENYKEIIKNLEIEQNVTILGYKDNPYKYLSHCDLFVCSSYREGFSTAVSEAIITGLPVVTTRCSGMVEILGENNEYGVITNNNEDSLYISIKDLLSDLEKLKFYKNKAIERSQFFSLAKSIEKVEELLDY
jgi:glycosyltransferase involved in cell wall biosynthesis